MDQQVTTTVMTHEVVIHTAFRNTETQHTCKAAMQELVVLGINKVTPMATPLMSMGLRATEVVGIRRLPPTRPMELTRAAIHFMRLVDN